MKKFKNAASKSQTLKQETTNIEHSKPGPVKIIAARPEPPNQARASFELIKPDAKSACVAGSFNDWRPERAPLVPTGNGRWVADVALKPGRHEYLFVVDGQWIPDPNAKETVQNPFGGRNSILGVSE